jgi:microcystin-dependent protein
MSQPYLGEIRCFGFNFAPRGWAFCNGQNLAIAQNTALFSLLGTTYGGNGQTTFALPNLQGRAPMHWGSPSGLSPTVLGQEQGTTSVTLISTQMPVHTHSVNSTVVAPGGLLEHTASPSGTAFVGPSNPDAIYKTLATINAQFSPSAISVTGGSQPHENMQPYLALNFCIALEGVFPSRN